MNRAAAGVDGVSAGWLGFLVIVLLGVVTALLIRNMNARLRRLPETFEKTFEETPVETPEDPASPE